MFKAFRLHEITWEVCHREERLQRTEPRAINKKLKGAKEAVVVRWETSLFEESDLILKQTESCKLPMPDVH